MFLSLVGYYLNVINNSTEVENLKIKNKILEVKLENVIRKQINLERQLARNDSFNSTLIKNIIASQRHGK